MKIGIPKEIKDHEYRVGMIPAGVHSLVEGGHEVSVQGSAGLGSGIADEEYEEAGATIVPDAQSVFGGSDMIIKVKEPIEPEYELLQEGQILYTYFIWRRYRSSPMCCCEKGHRGGLRDHHRRHGHCRC